MQLDDQLMSVFCRSCKIPARQVRKNLPLNIVHVLSPLHHPKDSPKEPRPPPLTGCELVKIVLPAIFSLPQTRRETFSTMGPDPLGAAVPILRCGGAVEPEKGTGSGADRLSNDEISIGRCRVAKVGQRWMLDPYLESEQGSLAKSLQYQKKKARVLDLGPPQRNPAGSRVAKVNWTWPFPTRRITVERSLNFGVIRVPS
ncbi:uncharacterized protein BDZ83DRAFT_636302 [Colletotrichum acutatum]|uniref:Uncharacterized protein n=1 Tax=Glomerella acutata TaxID=27357 RepID=A0AAD8UEJ6_GLOAC|nr:uncharacterized protein BDZ83DRAFT_636302 [Colletotrichum acutatum]KAK1714980.1 hypothetical protein BDZ83DRAFT_636302 [Colletotrichum acutatum]